MNSKSCNRLAGTTDREELFGWEENVQTSGASYMNRKYIRPAKAEYSPGIPQNYIDGKDVYTFPKKI